MLNSWWISVVSKLSPCGVFFFYMCLHLVTSFGVLFRSPHNVFNITPTKWGHMRQRLMKHMWGFHFALFLKGSSQSGFHAGYEKNLTSQGSVRKVWSNIVWCLTPIMTPKIRYWVLVCSSHWARTLEAVFEEWGLSLTCSDCCFYGNWHI